MLLLIVVATATLAATLTFPALTGRVVDNAHILQPASIESLTAALASHEQATGEQIVVVTLPSLQGQEIEEYSNQLFRAWGIGQKGKDNGALMIVAPNEHKARIEVGYGLEGQLTDAASAGIVQNIMLPNFRQGDYDTGIVAGARAVLSVLGGADANTVALSPAVVLHHNSGLSPQAIFFIIFLLLYLISRFSGRRQSMLGPLVLGSMLSRSGGGFGGGGFSGGGGSSGGGGASGSW